MRKFLLVLLGLPVLLAGAVLLWTARGPVPKHEVTTGSALEAMPMALAADAPFSPIDEGDAGFAAGAPDVEPQALEEGSGGFDAEAAELEFQAETSAALRSVPLTSDLMLEEEVPIGIEPLDDAAERAAAEESRGGPVVPAAFEQRVVELEWPSQFRVGGSGTVRVKLRMLDDGLVQPVAEIADNEITATPIIIPDNYTTHDAQLTTTLSAPDFAVEALSPETQTLQKGGEAEWRWTLSAESSGQSVIAIGITLTWVNKTDNRPETTISLWGQALQVDVNYVFGSITVPQASIAGTVLAVIGFVAEIPLIDAIFEVFGKIFFGRRRRSKASAKRRR